MIEFTVRIDWGLLVLAGLVGTVLASLYAVALSTERGRRVCERRTHWTVIGGHLLMALTMGFVSAPMAGLWLLWSALHGLPLVIRSEVMHWREEDRVWGGFGAALRAFGGMGVRDEDAGSDRGGGDGHGAGGAGGGGAGGVGGAGSPGTATWTAGQR